MRQFPVQQAELRAMVQLRKVCLLWQHASGDHQVVVLRIPDAVGIHGTEGNG